MYPEAREWVAAHAPTDPVVVVEFGGADINGGVRDVFHHDTTWTCVDLVDGDSVDVIGDAATYRHPHPVDLVVCCEVAEHYEFWPELVTNAATLLDGDGRLILTAATHGRAPHGAWGDPRPAANEWYGNISPDDLRQVAESVFDEVTVDVAGTDVRMVADA